MAPGPRGSRGSRGALTPIRSSTGSGPSCRSRRAGAAADLLRLNAHPMLGQPLLQTMLSDLQKIIPRYQYWPVLDPQPEHAADTKPVRRRWEPGEHRHRCAARVFGHRQRHRLYQPDDGDAARRVRCRRRAWRVHSWNHAHCRRLHSAAVRLSAIWGGRLGRERGLRSLRPGFVQQVSDVCQQPGLRVRRLPGPAAGTLGGERQRELRAPCHLSRSGLQYDRTRGSA